MFRTKFLSFCFALLAISGTASAAVVTFDTLPGVNEDPFTSITENGITVTSTAGVWQQGFIVGNPIPSIFMVDSSNPGLLTGSLTVTTGGLFTFLSFDLGTGGDSNPSYSYEGFLDNVSILTGFGAPAGNTFLIVNSSGTSVLLDRLVISTTLTSSSANIDNITLGADTSVPEPGTVMLGAFGLAGIYLARRRCA